MMYGAVSFRLLFIRRVCCSICRCIMMTMGHAAQNIPMVFLRIDKIGFQMFPGSAEVDIATSYPLTLLSLLFTCRKRTQYSAVIL